MGVVWEWDDLSEFESHQPRGPPKRFAGLEREQLLYLVRNCIHLSAEFTRRRSKLLGMLDTPEQLWWLKGTLGTSLRVNC
jgi:hypothetical protein